MADRHRDERQVTICNLRGLHARAAARFVRCADRFEAKVTVRRDDRAVSGHSIMGLMLLAAAEGSELTLSATGPDRRAVLDALETLIIDGFGET